MNEISHEATHGHDHHSHTHEHHEHASQSLRRNNTIITLNAYTQDEASVISLEWSSCEDVKQTEILLKQLFKNIARNITEQNGIIGHIKASMERSEVIMISLTDTEAMKKEALSPTIKIHAAVIALFIDKKILTQIVESAIDSSPYSPSDHKEESLWQKRKNTL